jgi:hypothetical protein
VTVVAQLLVSTQAVFVTCPEDNAVDAVILTTTLADAPTVPSAHVTARWACEQLPWDVLSERTDSRCGNVSRTTTLSAAAPPSLFTVIWYGDRNTRAAWTISPQPVARRGE